MNQERDDCVATYLGLQGFKVVAVERVQHARRGRVKVVRIERRTIKPDALQSIYPFKGVKLGRADVEWLLATHDNGLGPVDWNKESQPDPYFARKGLDFRGADLRGVDLRELPLARLLGGDLGEFGPKTDAQHETEAIHLEEEMPLATTRDRGSL